MDGVGLRFDDLGQKVPTHYASECYNRIRLYIKRIPPTLKNVGVKRMYFYLNKFKIYYARECKLAKTQYGTAISITSPKDVSLENSSLTPRERDNNIEINELEILVPLLDKILLAKSI